MITISLSVGFGITALCSLYLMRELNRHKGELLNIKDREKLRLDNMPSEDRLRNERIISTIAPILPEGTLIKDTNNSLEFLDKEGNQIGEDYHRSILVSNSDKEVDGSMYSYSRVYAVVKDTTDEVDQEVVSSLSVNLDDNRPSSLTPSKSMSDLVKSKSGCFGYTGERQLIRGEIASASTGEVISKVISSSELLSKSIVTFLSSESERNIEIYLSTDDLSSIGYGDSAWSVIVVVTLVCSKGKKNIRIIRSHELSPKSINEKSYMTAKLDGEGRIKSLSMSVIGYRRYNSGMVSYFEVESPIEIYKEQNNICLIMG